MLRWELLWGRVRDSLWFVPTMSVVLAVALAVGLISVERLVPLPWLDEMPWFFGGGPEAAREMLSTIAGSLITVTGVVFSVTVVALQLASSQYSPRVLRGYIGDRVNQYTLGVLIGTFTYALLVMRSVRTDADDRNIFVPNLAVTVAMLLLLASIGALIAFINRSTRSIQVESIVNRLVRKTRVQIEETFPKHIGEADHALGREPTLPASPHAEIRAEASGYLQAVEADELFDLAVDREITIALEPHVGDFVLSGETIARVWPDQALDEHLAHQVQRALAFGHERTDEQDIEFGFVGISDIAVRALSPGINDPTTAVLCIDRIAELLRALGERAWPAETRIGPDGLVRFVAQRSRFERCADISIGHIRLHGLDNPRVALHLLQMLRRLGALLPPMSRPVLARHAASIMESVRERPYTSADRAGVESLGARTLAWLGGSEVAPDPDLLSVRRAAEWG